MQFRSMSLKSSLIRSNSIRQSIIGGGSLAIDGFITASDLNPTEGDVITLTFTDTSIAGSITASDTNPTEGDIVELEFVPTVMEYQWIDGNTGDDLLGEDELTVEWTAALPPALPPKIRVSDPVTGQSRVFSLIIGVGSPAFVSPKIKPASTYNSIPAGNVEIDLASLTAGDFTSTTNVSFTGGVVRAASAGVSGNCYLNLDSVIDFSQPFQLSIEFVITNPTEGNSLTLLAGKSTAWQSSDQVTVCNASGNIAENAYGWTTGTAITAGSYVWSIVGDGTFVSSCIVRSSGDPFDWSSGFFAGSASLKSGKSIASAVVSGVQQYTGWNRITITTSSTANYVSKISFNRGGWGGFAGAATRAFVWVAPAKFTAGEIRCGCWLPSGFSTFTQCHQVEYHHQNLGDSLLITPQRWLWGPMYQRGMLIYSIQGTDSLGVGGLSYFNAAEYKSNNWGSDHAGSAGATAFSVRRDVTDFFNQFTVGARVACGISMGGMNSLQLYRLHPEEYDAIAIASPVTNLQKAYSEFTSRHNAAWGVSSYSEISTSDPMNNSAAYRNVPVFMRYTTNDNTIDFTDGHDLFAAVPNKITTDIRATVGHLNEADVADTNGTLASWLESLGATSL